MANARTGRNRAQVDRRQPRRRRSTAKAPARQADNQMNRRYPFAMAVINLAVDELIREGYTLPEIIAALQDYTKAAQIAETHQRSTAH